MALIDCKECMEEYGFACQALNVSVAEPRERSVCQKFEIRQLLLCTQSQLTEVFFRFL
jgi:hypothetical protein